jgi:hypothetical protein
MHWVVVVGAQLISTSSRQQLPTLEARNDRQMHDGLHLHERVPPAAPSEEPARNQQTKLARAAYLRMYGPPIAAAVRAPSSPTICPNQ